MNASQLELTLDKLQLIATTVVPPHHKLRWLRWWNSSIHTREAVRFPLRPVNEERLTSFIVRAAWWAGVSFYISFDLVCLHSFSTFILCKSIVLIS